MRLIYATLAAALPAALIAQPVVAEVTEERSDGFVTRDEAVVEADPKAVWLALISPGKWWNDSHTWSGDASNMTLRPQAGGCFCERIPEDPDPEKITLEGSVEHMRVIHAFPEKSLLMRGGLGPLQTEPASGVLTIALTEVEEGTRIVWTYNVGGPMRYEIPVISKAVDGVMSQQLDGLAAMLGRVDASQAEDSDDAAEDDAEPAAEQSVEDAIDAMADN